MFSSPPQSPVQDGFRDGKLGLVVRKAFEIKHRWWLNALACRDGGLPYGGTLKTDIDNCTGVPIPAATRLPYLIGGNSADSS